MSWRSSGSMTAFSASVICSFVGTQPIGRQKKTPPGPEGPGG